MPHAGDVQDVATAADAEITWVVRGGGGTALPPDADPRTSGLPPAAHPYAWIAGGSGRVKELRRHFARERGADPRRITFVGYWRRGLTEEELREQEAWPSAGPRHHQGPPPPPPPPRTAAPA